MTYIPEHFRLQELVPRDLYNKHNGSEKLWLLFDMYLLQEADRLRKRYGACYVNNWHNGGNLQQCGFRNDLGTGAEFSQHRFGRALDLHFVKVTAEEVRQELIKDCQQGRNEIIKGIELGVSWLHIDVRNSDKFVLFNP